MALREQYMDTSMFLTIEMPLLLGLAVIYDYGDSS